MLLHGSQKKGFEREFVRFVCQRIEEGKTSKDGFGSSSLQAILTSSTSILSEVVVR